MPKLTLSFKGQTLSVHHLEDGSAMIGRDPACAISIESLAIALKHAEVITQGDTCRIRALSPEHPVYVNGTAAESSELQHGDIVKLGKHALIYASEGHALAGNEEAADASTDDNGDGKAKEKTASAFVQILSGEHIGRVIPLSRNMIRLGRPGGNCAMIVHREGGFFLSHLEGEITTLDGVPIGSERVMLTAGNVIRIGDTELQFYT